LIASLGDLAIQLHELGLDHSKIAWRTDVGFGPTDFATEPKIGLLGFEVQ
jgi:hypothetical protein